MIFILTPPALLTTSLAFDWPKQLVCFTNPFRPCGVVLEEALNSALESQRELKPENQPAPPPQPAPAPTPQSPIDRARYKISVTFAGFNRDAFVKPLLARLSALGWSNAPAVGDAKRDGRADGKSEVRFGVPTDKAAAERLAADVKANLITRRSIDTKLDPAVAGNELQIWISQ